MMGLSISLKVIRVDVRSVLVNVGGGEKCFVILHSFQFELFITKFSCS